MHRRLSLSTVVVLGVALSGGAIAQTVVSLEKLSQYERTAASRLINGLHSKNEQAFTSELNRFAEDFASRGLDPKPVVTVLRASAGDQREALSRILASQCRDQSVRKTFYCDIAQVQEPNPAEVQTAATGAAAGGGGGALGGALSTSSTSAGGGGGNAGGDSIFRSNSAANFSFRGGSGSSVSDSATTFVTTTSTLPVPGPTAGAGLGGLVIAGALAWRARRRRKAA